MAENSITIEFVPTATGGFPPDERAIVARALSQVRGRMVRVTITEVVRTASSPQMRYYRGTLLPMVHKHFKAHGCHTVQEETHEYLKRNVGGFVDYTATPDSKGGYPTRSFSRDDATCPDVREMGEFFEKVWAWAASIGLYIPSPKEPLTD